MRYVIIGSGVAGIAAVEAIRSVHPSPDLALPRKHRDNVSGVALRHHEVEAGNGGGVEITLLSDDPHGFYSRPGLAYYLTGELHDKALFPRTPEDFRRLHFRYVKGRVTQIRREEHQLALQDQ